MKTRQPVHPGPIPKERWIATRTADYAERFSREGFDASEVAERAFEEARLEAGVDDLEGAGALLRPNDTFPQPERREPTTPRRLVPEPRTGDDEKRSYEFPFEAALKRYAVDLFDAASIELPTGPAGIPDLELPRDAPYTHFWREGAWRDTWTDDDLEEWAEIIFDFEFELDHVVSQCPRWSHLPSIAGLDVYL